MDQFQDKAKKGLEFLKSRANEAVEVQKLSSKIKQLEHRRDECILDLGHRVFVMFEMDRFDPDSLTDRVREIRDINQELEERMEEARKVKDHLRTSVEDILPRSGARPVSSAPPPPTYSTEPEPEPEIEPEDAPKDDTL